MSRRGGCKQCAWLKNGRICTSRKAMKLTSKGNLKEFFNTKVREHKQFWDKNLKRTVHKFEYHGCFLYTFKTDKIKGVSIKGVSGFLRRRTHAD